MFKRLFRKLFPEKSKTDFAIAYIANRFFMERINADPVLVVGDYTNRDYETLKKRLGRIYSLDVVDNPHIPKEFYLKQSIEDRIPFPDGYFKCVLLAEVIENVWRDRDAMLEINRVLAEDGVLLMSLEFYADEPLHYHVYSPDSLDLLLRHSNFDAKEIRYQGFVTKFMGARFSAALAIFLYPIFHRKALSKVNEMIWFLDGLLKNSKNINGVFEMTAYILAKKSGAAIDPIEVQRRYYEPYTKAHAGL
ncbi:MAG: hypothetical protein A2855_01695 [Candidatus Liptonbacteria bacterium RIFCSPHIGHO2_01_FULL_57_28]|uniref:Methyltransferase type 11 domain-containing protein n=1 Tax=Candidatus Liptonbacteria bacterium RIFCSPHIGHO2_01_FULL_57_28 TaxID=1798647 RepID=A0A1G2C9B4_9BACT|nr:MAG: hypothetical protein A2855_01695 [Candidatus Liptonbacteria bacterium RIFCSPHIGHO2_01_FULL_57_28]